MNKHILSMALMCLFVNFCALSQKNTGRYIISDSVLIHTKGGATISAVVVRTKEMTKALPAALFFFMYANLQRSLSEAKSAADHGYVGIVADTRGKRLSPDVIEPYEHESKDVNQVIDWIIHQPWSDGRVGMYGGSYSGFAQWAAAKRLHPALKTIVPYAAAIPGQGLPMENNVFLTANYQWPFYVTNNKYTDDAINNDNARFRKMRLNWFASGAAYQKIDSVDGAPNPWLQKWLKHPSYDSYWQSMVPYREDFAQITIPVLTVTGYYDDGQISALHYLREHYRYYPQAEHYLVIGPYDHFGAQRGGTEVLREYKVDSIALINTRELTFQWFDYIFKNAKKPALLKNKINFQVMGANTWKHSSSIQTMSDTTMRLYLTENKDGRNFSLAEKKPSHAVFLQQQIDLADRNNWNNSYYPDPIIRKDLDTSTGLFFISEPFEKAVTVSGILTGELKAIINKKDMDIGVVLYEAMPDGGFFELAYFLGRASYAKDMSRRKLLAPGKMETIPFDRSRMFSRKLSKGSRLLVVLDIDKNPFAQVNYGTGKDVSRETVKDAGAPLRIKWSTESYINIGISY
jgi:putative CocE/NonD family hydrolase